MLSESSLCGLGAIVTPSISPGTTYNAGVLAGEEPHVYTRIRPAGSLGYLLLPVVRTVHLREMLVELSPWVMSLSRCIVREVPGAPSSSALTSTSPRMRSKRHRMTSSFRRASIERGASSIQPMSRSSEPRDPAGGISHQCGVVPRPYSKKGSFGENKLGRRLFSFPRPPTVPSRSLARELVGEVVATDSTPTCWTPGPELAVRLRLGSENTPDEKNSPCSNRLFRSPIASLPPSPLYICETCGSEISSSCEVVVAVGRTLRQR